MKFYFKKSLMLNLLLCLIVFAGCQDNKKEERNKEEAKDEKNITISDSLKWSERMALSVMKRDPEAWQIDNKEKPKLNYKNGLVLTAFQQLYEETGNKKYYNYIKEYADILIDSTGAISTYDLEEYNIDMINSGKILFMLYDESKDEKYFKAMKQLRKQLEDHPRTTEGGYWHKNIYPSQMWLDGLYMGAPFYAQYTVEFEEGKNLDDVAKQFEIIQKHTVDKETGLLFHAWDESKNQKWADKVTGKSPNFWSRSLGWYAMALVDVLDYFPEDHPKHQELVSYLNNLAEALVKVQHESGLWYQVTDKGDRKGNYLEASGSAMLAYSLGKGVSKGYLPKKFRDTANKALDGLTRDLIKVDEDGEIHITQVCASAGLGGDPYRDGSFDYYINEPIKVNNSHGTGPFILAALALNR